MTKASIPCLPSQTQKPRANLQKLKNRLTNNLLTQWTLIIALSCHIITGHLDLLSRIQIPTLQMPTSLPISWRAMEKNKVAFSMTTPSWSNQLSTTSMVMLKITNCVPQDWRDLMPSTRWSRGVPIISRTCHRMLFLRWTKRQSQIR